jgi:hypothetical protein
MKIRVCGLFVSLWVLALPSFAQDKKAVDRTDSLVVESQDTVLLKSYATRYNPTKALLYAAVVPGLGQVYNKKYWKLPLVYGGFISIGYAIRWYDGLYDDYKTNLYYNLENGYEQDNDIRPGDNHTTKNYRVAADNARRQRDFWVVMMGGMYLLQMIDAHVDAHLKEFDLNPKLQVSIEPMYEQDALLGRQTGVSLIVRF